LGGKSGSSLGFEVGKVKKTTDSVFNPTIEQFSNDQPLPYGFFSKKKENRIKMEGLFAAKQKTSASKNIKNRYHGQKYTPPEAPRTFTGGIREGIEYPTLISYNCLLYLGLASFRISFFSRRSCENPGEPVFLQR